MSKQMHSPDSKSLQTEVHADLDQALARVIRRSGLMDDVSLPAFERQLMGYLGVQEAIVVASGSDAFFANPEDRSSLQRNLQSLYASLVSARG